MGKIHSTHGGNYKLTKKYLLGNEKGRDQFRNTAINGENNIKNNKKSRVFRRRQNFVQWRSFVSAVTNYRVLLIDQFLVHVSSSDL